MKKLFFAIIAVGYVLSACSNPLVSKPVVPRVDDLIRSSKSPGNITATHGGKRVIELNWDEVYRAVRYNIFKAESPLMPFVQCAETTETRLEFTVPAGSTVYYRVSTVLYSGEESERSFYVKGSSLAQPVITDITDITETSATVTWYMDNVADDTYKASLRYVVYCFYDSNGSAQAADPLVINGSQLTQNRATFSGLLAGKEYFYQVEAYLLSDQSNSEKSEIVDGETARRMRPGAPINLTASRGTSPNTITLSFELPEMVSVALGAGEYDMYGLRFVISKRFYSEGGIGAYAKLGDFYIDPTEYEYGKVVTFDDIKENIRGRDYEYQVQSYVDIANRTITSDESKSTAVGWTLNKGTLSTGKPIYTLDETTDLYVNAQVPLQFSLDHKGVEYRYRVIETVYPIGDGNDYDLPEGSEIERKSALLNYQQITGYFAYMNLDDPSTASSPGRGLYSYKVGIHLSDEINPIETIAALGDVLVSEDVHPIVVEGFAIQDGYTNKFMIKWDSAPNRKYILYQSTDNQTWTVVATYNDPPPSSDEDDPAVSHIEELQGFKSGDAVYFAMEPIKVMTVGFNTVNKKGQRVYLPEAQTLGTPEVLPAPGYSYSTITAMWKETQKADTYQVRYRYAGASSWTTEKTLASSELEPDVTGALSYSFKPSGYNNVALSGKPIEIEVVALNEELRKNLPAGTPAISTSAIGNFQTRLVGPAELDAEASKALAKDKIELSWNKVEGAGGYYVFRRQFNMDDKAEERNAIVYYVPAQAPTSGNINVLGKDLIKIGADEIIDDTLNIKAKASLANSRYTLTDEYMSDDEYNSHYSAYIQTYRDQQNELAWGGAYRYFIVPVLSNEPLNSIEFAYAKDFNNNNTGITAYTLQESDGTISYSGAAAIEKTGFTYGFGLEVTASKGTKSESGQVEITWKVPPLLATVDGFDPRYVVFRRQNARSESSTWTAVSGSSGTISMPSFTDTHMTQNRGKACDYAVGIYPAGGDPNDVLLPTSARFIRIAKERYVDDRGRPKLIGFTLASVPMIQVSRSQKDEEGRDLKDSQGNFGEKVEWYAGGIDGADSYIGNLYDNNWGIDGYEIYVMNRNIDRTWHQIAEIANPPNNTNQNIIVYNVAGGDTLQGGLLKIMRDYRHYYMIRSYVFNDQNEKVLCPEPQFTYQYWVGDQKTGSLKDQETDYIKWGTRQITTNEFVVIATLFMADGLQRVNGNSWYYNTGSPKTANASGNYGASGSIVADSDLWGNEWELKYSNFKTDMYTRAQDWVTFITVNGNSWCDTDVSARYPWRYGDAGWIDITGPISGLHTGSLRIGGSGYTDMQYSNNGTVRLIFPAGTGERQITFRGSDTALPFYQQGDERYNQDQFK